MAPYWDDIFAFHNFCAWASKTWTRQNWTETGKTSKNGYGFDFASRNVNVKLKTLMRRKTRNDGVCVSFQSDFLFGDFFGGVVF